jgi:hypothetical protein
MQSKEGHILVAKLSFLEEEVEKRGKTDTMKRIYGRYKLEIMSLCIANPSKLVVVVKYYAKLIATLWIVKVSHQGWRYLSQAGQIFVIFLIFK